ncbi:MAG: hypothetical protein IKU23_08445 [Clostridia bacterium]|nr:hypothetical protein [Clostridia bacterium]
MKKIILFTAFLLSISCLLCGCFPDVMYIPDESYIGQAKKFEKDKFSILLTDKFAEEESQRGFDAYFVADFCGVVVIKEEFTLEEGLAEKSLEEYTISVIANNGHANITPQTEDGLWFYERTTDSSYARSYCFKGTDSFWIVQFLCSQSDAQSLKDTFYLWAQSVEVK